MFSTKNFSALAAAVLCVSFAVTAANPADAQTKSSISPKQCGAAVDGELQKLGVARDNVEEITYVEQHFSGRSSPSSVSRGVSAWVQMKSCRGQIVVEMGPNCSVYSRYTKGQCQVSGLPTY